MQITKNTARPRYLCKDCGKFFTPQTIPTEIRRKKILALHEAGMKNAEIAKQIGVTKQAVGLSIKKSKNIAEKHLTPLCGIVKMRSVSSGKD